MLRVSAPEVVVKVMAGKGTDERELEGGCIGKEKGEKCKDCGEVGKGGEKWIECEMCQGWYHLRCQELTTKMGEWVEKGREKGIHWFCKGCDEGLVKRLRFEKELTDRQDRMTADILQMKREIEEIKMSMQKKVVSFAEIVGKENMFKMADVVGGSGGLGAGDRKFQMQFTEAMDIEKRKCNVILLGVEEGDNLETEKELVNRVLSTLGVDSSEIAEYEGRIGKKGSREGHKRPIRVKLDKIEAKRKMLARSGKLKDEEGLKNVYVAEDLTWKQLEVSRILRHKLWKFREEGRLGMRIDTESRRIIQRQGDEVKVLFQFEEC